MPSVADELAALRAGGSVKKRSTALGGAASLSTPEAEAAALKAKRDNARVGDKKAKEILARGSNAGAAATLAHATGLTAKKKADAERKAEASEMLKAGGSAGGYSQEMEHSLGQTGKKKAEWEARVRARAELAGTAGGATGATAEVAAPAAPAEEPAPAPAADSSVPKEEPAADSSVQVAEEGDDDDDAVPDLEVAAEEAPEAEAPQAAEQRQVANRNEKKARKMMTRLGMRPVPQIARVTLKAAGNRGYFFIDRPDVFVGGKGETYVVFGEAKQGGAPGMPGPGDAAQAARAQAAMAQQKVATEGKGMPIVEEEGVPEVAEERGGGGGDEEGVEAKDIDLVVSQASCTRAQAAKALRENDGDLVNAIMSLTT